jgi:hypothetical protein
MLDFVALDDIAATLMVNLAHDIPRNHERGRLSSNSDQSSVEARRKAAGNINTPLRARVCTDMHHDTRQSHGSLLLSA